MSVVLIDNSGSMVGTEKEVLSRLEGLGADDVIIAFSYKEDPPIRVVSDLSEEVDLELVEPEEKRNRLYVNGERLEFHGPSPIAETLEAIAEMTDESITVVTDGMPQDIELTKQVAKRIRNEVQWDILGDYEDYTGPRIDAGPSP